MNDESCGISEFRNWNEHLMPLLFHLHKGKVKVGLFNVREINSKIRAVKRAFIFLALHLNALYLPSL